MIVDLHNFSLLSFVRSLPKRLWGRSMTDAWGEISQNLEEKNDANLPSSKGFK
jgi:hypothetical protein